MPIEADWVDADQATGLARSAIGRREELPVTHVSTVKVVVPHRTRHKETMMTKQVVAVLGGTGQQSGGVVDALLGAGKFAVRVASRNPASDAAGVSGARRGGRPGRSARPEQPPLS